MYKRQIQVSGSVSAPQSLTPTTSDNLTFTLDPADFTAGETVTVTVDDLQVVDQDATDPPDNLAADFVFDFIIASAVPICDQPFTPIYQIQGSGATAAVTGAVVTEGIVVGDFQTSAGLEGFFIQDPTGDANTATSDGIFVYTGATDNTVNAGDSVHVTAYARERFGQTTLNGSNSDTAAVTAANIVDCGDGSVNAVNVTMPFASTTAPELYEGMLVKFPQTLVIAEYFNYDQFGEVVLALPLTGEDRPHTPTSVVEPGAPAIARAADNAVRRITLDDNQGGSNPATLRHPNGLPFSLTNRFRGGDEVTDTTGVLGYGFSLYRVHPTAGAEYMSVNPRPVAPDAVGGSLRVAAMNTLNFFITADYPSGPLDNKCGASQTLECRGHDFDQPTEFTRQRDKLLEALAGLDADVIGLNEIENTPGVEPLGDPTNGVVAGLNAMLGAGTYAYIDTGVLGTDAIRVGLIYKPAEVTPIGAFQTLDSSDDPRFASNNRPALAQTFEEVGTGARFTVAVNHLKSKGSACSGDPDTGDGQGNCNVTRTNAAKALVDWLATDPTGSGDPDFLIMGDLNSYAKEDPIDAIKLGADDTASTSDDYVNLIFQFEGLYAYSYTFEAQAGYLDHALAINSLASQVTGATEWHINSDEPDVVDYDTSFKPPAQEALYEDNPYRSSDHDAALIGLNLTPPPDTTAPDVTINQASGQADPTNTSPINFTVVFNEPVTGFGDAAGDVTLSGTAGATTAVVSEVAPMDGTTYNVAVSGMISHGTVIATVGANVAEDAAGNDNTASISTDNTVTYDATAPNTTITVSPPNPSNSSTATFEFTGDDGTGVGGLTFECRVNGGLWIPCTSPQSYPGLIDGSYTFEVRAKDSLGNTDGSPASYTWVIDTTGPTVTFTTTPTDPSNDATPTFAFTSESGATFECQLDGGLWAACTSPQTLGPLSDGSHTFKVRATDTLGNVGPDASYTWVIDTTGPTTTFTTTPTNPSNDETPTFAFTSESGATFECQLDGGLWTVCTSPQTLGPLNDGSHTFKVRATDALGNVGPEASYTWLINTTVPPTAPDVYVTAEGVGSVDGIHYDKNDILLHNAAGDWSLFFNGTAAGLPAKADLTAIHVNAADDLYLSFGQANLVIPGFGKVNGSDIIHYDGGWSWYFDGSDVDLTTSDERVDSLHILPGSAAPVPGCIDYVLISTRGKGRVSNPGQPAILFSGEDVLGFCATSQGQNTAGRWFLVLDGSRQGMPNNSTISLAANADGTVLYLTTRSTFSVDGATGGHSMVYKYDTVTQTFSGPYFSAPAEGLTKQVDGLHLSGMLP